MKFFIFLFFCSFTEQCQNGNGRMDSARVSSIIDHVEETIELISDFGVGVSETKKQIEMMPEIMNITLLKSARSRPLRLHQKPENPLRTLSNSQISNGFQGKFTCRSQRS